MQQIQQLIKAAKQAGEEGVDGVFEVSLRFVVTANFSREELATLDEENLRDVLASLADEMASQTKFNDAIEIGDLLAVRDGATGQSLLLDNSSTLYVIYSPNESACSDGAGFWSNRDSWTELDEATVFSDSERQSLNLPISTGQDAKWVLLGEARQHYGKVKTAGTTPSFANRLSEYLAGGNKCPFCGSEDLDYGDGDFGTEAGQEVVCSDCEARWVDAYKMTHIVISDIGTSGVEQSEINDAMPSWFAVTGRIPFDDEDTTHIFFVGDQKEAVRLFEEAMYEGEPEGRREQVIKESGRAVFLTNILASATEIREEGRPI